MSEPHARDLNEGQAQIMHRAEMNRQTIDLYLVIDGHDPSSGEASKPPADDEVGLDPEAHVWGGQRTPLRDAVHGENTGEETTMVKLAPRPETLMHLGLTLALGATLFLAGPAGAQVSLEALSAQVAALQQNVSTLQGQVNALQNVQALDPFVSVDPNPRAGVAGPHIIFSGANLHVVSGSGATNDGGTPRGLGNLIIGYDEDPAQSGSPPLNPGDRGGSHNVVIGASHRFTQAAFGGLVAGAGNTISNTAASVSGGANNTASGQNASVSGGFGNTASGNLASISGGFGNTASGVLSSVSGGLNNEASGASASVSGGRDNTASGENASVSGGFSSTASGKLASVSGGANNGASGENASVSGGSLNGARATSSSVSGGSSNDARGIAASVNGGSFNTARGTFASVSGGNNNTARGDVAVVIGGLNVVGDPFTGSIDPQPPFPFTGSIDPQPPSP